MPVEDGADPHEGSEEAEEPRTDTPEGEGGGEPAGPSEGAWIGLLEQGGKLWRQTWEAGIPDGVEPDPVSGVRHALCGVSIPLSIPTLGRDSSPCSDGTLSEKCTPTPEPEPCEVTEPLAKRPRR